MEQMYNLRNGGKTSSAVVLSPGQMKLLAQRKGRRNLQRWLDSASGFPYMPPAPCSRLSYSPVALMPWVHETSLHDYNKFLFVQQCLS